MKFKLNLLAFLLFTGITTVSYSQSSSKTDVNKDIDVIRVYEQVVVEGYATPFIYKQLLQLITSKVNTEKHSLGSKNYLRKKKTQTPNLSNNTIKL